MKRSCLYLPLTCLLFAVGCSKEFKEFTSKEGGFKVMMPTDSPKKQSKAVPGQRMKMTMWGYEEKNGIYMVAYADMSSMKAIAEAGGMDTFFEGAKRGAVANLSRQFPSKIVDEKKIKLDGKYPGRELTATIKGDGKKLPKDARMRVRLYWVDGKFYQVMAMGRESWLSSGDTDTFLDSFELLK